MRGQLEHLRSRFEQDHYARRLGIVLEELTETTVRMSMTVNREMINWFGRPHGGAIYSLADAAFSVLANNGGNLSVALDCSITYHASPPPSAHLVVTGRQLSLTARTGGYLFTVYHEHDGRLELVATMKSVAYRTGKSIVPESRE